MSCKQGKTQRFEKILLRYLPGKVCWKIYRFLREERCASGIFRLFLYEHSNFRETMKRNNCLWRASSLMCLAGLLVSCGDLPQMEGTWVEPVPGMENSVQGFKLEEGGKASSVNMATLQYESWKQEGDKLVLSGKSIGNGVTIPFSDTLEIAGLTQDSLFLKRGTLVLRYVRNDGQGDRSVPMAEFTPAKKTSFRTTGVLVFAHERRAFTPDGDTVSYWVIDKTGELLEAYDKLTGGVKNGKPVYAELEVIDAGKSDEGFAASYPSVYQVVKIDSMSLEAR